VPDDPYKGIRTHEENRGHSLRFLALEHSAVPLPLRSAYLNIHCVVCSSVSSKLQEVI